MPSKSFKKEDKTLSCHAEGRCSIDYKLMLYNLPDETRHSTHPDFDRADIYRIMRHRFIRGGHI